MPSPRMTRRARLRADFERTRLLAAALPANRELGPPIPPPLPPGATVTLSGRGETFIRIQDGPEGGLPVLLLHGWTASGDTNWFATFPALAPHHRAICIDHRGHGRGMRPEAPFSLEDCADDCAALLDELGIPEAILVGYSMGGPIALLTAQRHPSKVAGLVLCATALEWKGGLLARWQWRFLSVMEWGMRRGKGDSLIARWMHYASTVNPSLSPYRAWLAGEVRRATPADIVGAGRALSQYDFRPFAGAVRAIPSSVVFTTRDRLVKRRQQRALIDALGSEVFEIAEDHDACVVAPEAFGAVVVAAISSVATRAQGRDR